MFNELLPFLSLDDNIKEIVITGKEITAADASRSLCIYFDSVEELFTDKKFGLKDIGVMDRIIKECAFDTFKEDKEGKILFSKDKTSYNKTKIEADLIVKPQLTKKELMDLFTKNKIEGILSLETIENIKKVINYRINDIIRFHTSKGKLFVSSEGYQDKIEMELFETDKKIDNYYIGSLLLSILKVVEKDNKIVIDYNVEEKSSMPLNIRFKNKLGSFFYLLIPIERKE